MELIQEFKNYLLIQRKQPSKATVKNYVADVKKFIAWYEQNQGRTFNPTLVTLPLIEAYKQAKIAEFTASSIDRHLSSLKKFFTFLKLEGKIAANPLEGPIHLKQAPTDPWHLKEFKDFLYVYNASHLTIKNYLIDIKQFLTWFEQAAIDEDSYLVSDRNLLQRITDQVLQEYATRLYREGKFSGSSVNRKLSSLRKYLTWAHAQGYLAANTPTLPANIPASLLNEMEENTNDKQTQGDEIRETIRVEDFSQAQNMVLEEDLVLDQEEENELRNSATETVPGLQDYSKPPRRKIDLNAASFASDRTPEDTKAYSKIPPVRLFQKLLTLSSLGLDFAVVLPLAFIASQLRHRIWILRGKPLLTTQEVKLPTRQLPYRVRVKNLSKAFYNPLAISIRHFPWHKKLLYHIQYTRPAWYRRYSNLAVARYFNFAILMIFCAMIGFGLYSTFFSSARKSPTLATGPVAPPRVLSFQGRLTDNNDNPITTANTHLRFAIYNSSSASGSALLWQEVDDVNPDTDGDFSTILGNNTTIPQSVFAQNNALWLGVTVEWTPELTPRQQIATVAFATNSEVLQGMPPITQGATGAQANANTVLALDSTGNLNLGQVTTTIQSTSGQFILSGKTLTLTTTPGSNTNIELAPDGSGLIDLQKPVQNSTLNNNIPSAAGAVEIDDLLAVLATSSGQSAFTINQNSTGPLISASTSGVAKFTVDNSGNVTATGNVSGSTIFTGNGVTYYINNATSNLNSLTLASNLTVSGTVNSDLIPGGATGTWSLGDPTHEWKNLYAQNLYINGQAFTQLFQRNAGVLSPLNIGDDIAVGGTSTASAKFQIFGLTGNATTTGTLTFAGGANNIIAARNNQGLTIGDSQTGNVNFSNVNVGINATTPLAKLDVRGALSSVPVASISGNTNVPVLVVDNVGTGNLFSAQANGAQVFKIDTSGITYASQFIDFNNNSYFLDPAATGTSLKVAGGVGIGANPTDFKVQVAGSIGPDTTNLYDLGANPTAGGKEWNNIYGQHLFSNGVEVTQLWQENLGALSPLNITDDLLLGATATTSARFAVTNIAGGTPTASLSAGLNSGTYLTADGTLATRALQSLTIGSTSTGNINLGTDATARAIALGNTTGATSLSLQAGTGNITLSGSTTTTYTIGTTAGTGLITLGQSTAGENINIGNAANSSSQQIQIGNGASAANTEVDILSGAGTAGTSTLKLGNNSRVGTIDIGNIAPNVTRTITIAGGNSANDDTVNILTGNPSVGTQTVNILTGSATGGIQALNLGTGTSAKTITLGGSGNNTITIGNTQTGGSISLGNAMTTGTLSIGGTGAQTGSITIGDGTGAQIIDLGNGSGNKTINIGGTGTSNTINIGSNQTAGKVNIGVASTLTTIMGSNFTSGGVAYATGSAMFFTTAGSSGQCLLSNGASAPSWGLCTFGNGNYWDLQNGALFAKNPTTDLLIGGSATNSAKFAVLDVAGGTPVASVSSGLNGNGMSISADGFLQTTNKSTLTIGGTTTGNIVLSPQNGSGTGTITFNGYSTGVLHSVSGLITSSAVDLQNDVTSVLRVPNGGTGLNALASGSLIYGSGGNTANTLAIGSENDMLAIVNGTLVWSPYATHSALFVKNNAQLNTVSSATNQILPTTNGTLNLGDGSHYFGTIYANNVVVPVGNGTSGFWQLSSNVISPVNNFYDLAVGGSATGSATPFQVFGSPNGSIPAGTASTSGNLSFRGTNSEIDLLGGTGLDIKSSPTGQGNAGLNSVLSITNIGNVTIAGTLAVNGNTLSTATTSTFGLLNGTLTTLNVAQGTSNLNFGTGGTTTSTFNGNFVLGDNVNLRTLTLNAKVGSEILASADNSHDLGATNDYWRSTFTNNLYVPPVNTVDGLWQVSNNVIRPYYNWQDLAIGGTASFSAQFQVFANSYTNDLGTVLGGTASTSGNLTFKGSTSSVTNFQTNLLNNSTLAFYNSVGGDKGITLTNPQLFFNNNGTIGIGTTNPLGRLDIRGNSSTNPVATISGTTSGTSLVISNTGTGNYLDINNGGVNIASFIQNGSLNHNTFVPGATDSYDLGSNPTSGGREWDTLYVRQVITPSGNLGSNYWQLTNSVLAPANLFNDLAVGGASTASATFHVIGSGVNSGQTNIIANGITTANVATVSATSLTSGNLFSLFTSNPQINNNSGALLASANLINVSSTNHTYMSLTNQDLTIGGHKNMITIANVNKVYIYDTTKDSDGGRWTSDARAQGSSWYNESRTASDACVIGTNKRCGQAAFPKKAIIVVTSNAGANPGVYIFDAKDNSLWMEFDNGPTTTSYMVGPTTNNNLKAVVGLNGEIYIAGQGSSGAAGLYVINFIKDTAMKYDVNGSSTANTTILNRNGSISWALMPNSNIKLTSTSARDVSANIVNGQTYFAVATPNSSSGCVTLANESTESLVANFGGVTNCEALQVHLTSKGTLYATIGNAAAATNFFLKAKYNAQNASGNNTKFDQAWGNNSSNSTYGGTNTDVNSSAISFDPGPASTSATMIPSAMTVTQGTSTVDGISDTVYLAQSSLPGSLMAFNINQASAAASSIKYYTKNYITEDMVGDIRGMWPFNESSGNISDASVKGNTLTVNGGITYSASGVRGTALTFNGSTGYLNCTDAACGGVTDLGVSGATKKLTLGAWIKTSNNAARQVIISKFNNGVSGAYFMSVETTGKILFSINSGTNVNSVRAVNDGNWHHVVATYDGTNSLIYIDGQLDGIQPNTTNIGSSTDDFRIGAYFNASAASGFFNGSIDEPFVSATPLTAGEIAHMYQVGYRALQLHSSRTIRGANIAADASQKLINGNDNVTAVATNMQNGNIYVGTQGGGVSVIGMDNDSIVDEYSSSINTTGDIGTAWSTTANNNFVQSIAAGQSYGSGTALVIGGSTNTWMETQDTTLKDFLATSYDPFGFSLTQSNLNVDSVLRVTNQLSTNLDNMAFGATSSAMLADAFRVDSNGNLLSRSLVNSTTAMQFMNAAGNTLLNLDTTGNNSLLGLYQPGGGNILIASNAAGTQFKVDNGGIITANSFVDSQSSTYFLDPAASAVSLTIAGTASSAGNLTFFGASTAHKVNILDNQSLGFYTSYAGDAGLASVPSLYIANSATGGNATGYVGIGTTNPYTGLEVASRSAFTEAVGSKNNPAINIKNTNTSNFNEKAELQFTVGGNSSPNAVITALYTDWTSPGSGAGMTGADLAFSTKTSTTGLTEAMRIKNNGNVGIGTTNPGQNLHIYSNANTSVGARIENPNTGASAFAQIELKNSAQQFNIGLGSSGTSSFPNKFFIYDQTANKPRITLDTSGNVGIGTTNPGATLDLGTGTIQGAGLSGDCGGQNDKLLWSSSIQQFLCGTDRSSSVSAKPSDQTLATTTLTNITSMAVSMGASEQWVFFMNVAAQTNTNADFKIQVNVPSGATGSYSVSNSDALNNGANNSEGDDGFNAPVFWTSNQNGTGQDFLLNGFVSNSTTPGNIQLLMAQNVATGSLVIHGPPSFALGYKISGADVAEVYYTKDPTVGPGDVVAIDPTITAGVKRTTGAYERNTLGVISTKPGQILAAHDGTGIPTPLALAGRVPVKVTNENGPILAGDMLTSSDIPGFAMKARRGGQMIGKAMINLDPMYMQPCAEHPQYLCGEVLMYINNTYASFDPNATLTDTGDLLMGDASPSASFMIPHYYTLTDSLGAPVEDIAALASAAIGNLRAGSIQAQQILTNSLAVATDNVSIAGQSLHDYVVGVVNEVLQNYHGPDPHSPIAEIDQLHTNLVSPLASDSAVMLDLNNSRVAVKNSKTGQTVASIDSSGNATFSGTLQGQNLAVDGDATISGTLHADRIEANSIAGLQAMVGTLSAQNITNVTNIYYSTPSGSTSRENNATGSGASGNNNYGLLTQADGFANIASFSAYLSYVPNLKATTGMFTDGLIALGPTTLTDTSVTGTLSVGSQMSLADSSINVLGGDLELQPLKQGGIAFVGGEVRIDTSGNLTVNGKSLFQGPIYASTISPLAGQDLTIQLGDASSSTATHAAPQLSVKNASGSGIFAINQLGDIVASGAANIAKLNFNFIQPAMAISDTEVVATSSAGTSAIGAYQTQLTIDNTNVTANSLIYITPVGNTATTPYLMRQVPGKSFTVGISVPSSKEVNFNWLIVN